MWRWSWAGCIDRRYRFVFSTYVEMILLVIIVLLHFFGILHVCGDDPIFLFSIRIASEYSPRMWRWSLALAGIRSLFKSILHVCGDDPNRVKLLETEKRYSPRMWRWSLHFSFLSPKVNVFSTYVEMILKQLEDERECKCILHVCGDDPIENT